MPSFFLYLQLPDMILRTIQKELTSPASHKHFYPFWGPGLDSPWPGPSPSEAATFLTVGPGWIPLLLSPKNNRGDEKRVAMSQSLPSNLQRLPLDQQKRGEMKKMCQPRPLSPVFVRTASSAPKAFGAFSRQETKMLFSQTWWLRSSPSSGACLPSIGIFHLRLHSLLSERLQ